LIKKKYLIITAVCATVLTWMACTVWHYYRPVGLFSSNPVARAQYIIEQAYVNPLTKEQKTAMEDAAINAMVNSLGDPYSRYLNIDKLSDYKETKQEEYWGIGVSINFDATENAMIVIAPYDGSPAQKAGLLPGDVVTQVDGTTVTADNYNALINKIKSGKEGSVTFRIRRDDSYLTIPIERAEVKRESVSYRMLEDGLGYVRISEFIHNSTEEFEAAISALKDQGMKGMVIDLRNNPGGYADSVLAMTDSLLPEGVIAYLEDNAGKREYFNSDEAYLPVPMVVLINQGTASASELMAGSLQAHGMAVIIGEKSYGKAVGQALFPVTDKTAIYLTGARYFTPKGECIDGVGIEPDVLVSLPEELMSKISVMGPEQDTQLAKAIEFLQTQTGQ